jgi:hypothetical protein
MHVGAAQELDSAIGCGHVLATLIDWHRGAGLDFATPRQEIACYL